MLFGWWYAFWLAVWKMHGGNVMALLLSIKAESNTTFFAPCVDENFYSWLACVFVATLYFHFHY